MKFTLGDIRTMKDPMTRLLENDLPVKIAWSLTKLVKVFDKELSEIEEFRISLIKKLGSDDGDGSIKIPDDKMEDFIEQFNELLQTEIEVEFIPMEIDKLENLTINTKDLLVMDKIFI